MVVGSSAIGVLGVVVVEGFWCLEAEAIEREREKERESLLFSFYSSETNINKEKLIKNLLGKVKKEIQFLIK